MSVSVQAQVTTSALSGKVIDDQNESIIGATVVAVHEPSGTVYGAVTNVDGRYTIQGMRTGGPYKVEISYVGYQKDVFTDIRLELGNTFVLDATMQPSSQQLGMLRRKSEHRKTFLLTGSSQLRLSTVIFMMW